MNLKLLHDDVMLIQKQKTKEINNYNNDSNALFERKLENVTEGLSHNCFNWLKKTANNNNNKENATIIANYIMSMKTETNLSDSYRKSVIILLSKFSIFFRNQKSFKSIVREDVLEFLDSFRKPESVDMLHQWHQCGCMAFLLYCLRNQKFYLLLYVHRSCVLF
jgi:hypothetical protein